MFSRISHWFGNGWEGIAEMLLTVFCVLFSLSIHEFAHGYAAYRMGDDTAKNMGRLNIRPLSHLDPIGAICLFLFGFGWAKPVPINPRNFKKGRFKSGMVLTSLAGPVSNLIVCFGCCLAYSVIIKVFGHVQLGRLAYVSITVVLTMLQVLISLNISLAVFNLIPIPPLDGSKILNAVLPARIYFKIMQYEQYGFIILIILINTPLFSFLLNFLATKILWVFDMIIGFLPFL